jgi:hypothetical protein
VRHRSPPSSHRGNTLAQSYIAGRRASRLSLTTAHRTAATRHRRRLRPSCNSARCTIALVAEIDRSQAFRLPSARLDFAAGRPKYGGCRLLRLSNLPPIPPPSETKKWRPLLKRRTPKLLAKCRTIATLGFCYPIFGLVLRNFLDSLRHCASRPLGVTAGRPPYLYRQPCRRRANHSRNPRPQSAREAGGCLR